jgi:hypothetical protein
METTIQVRKQTAQVLRDIKRKMNAKSYDEVIESLIKKGVKEPKSMFGSNPKLGPFTEEDRAEIRDYD